MTSLHEAETLRRLSEAGAKAIRRSHEKWAVDDAKFDAAILALNEWDRQCREHHAKLMAALEELRKAFP